MGLDMYLYAEKYESRHIYNGSVEPNFYPPELKKLQDLHTNRNFFSKKTFFQIGYWRKCWAIHEKIGKYCPDNDLGNLTWLSGETIEKLLADVNAVLLDNDKASERLPSDYYNDDYFKELRYTKKLLELAFDAMDAGYEIYYQASW